MKSTNKYVIYSVLTGGYDNILQPLVIDNRFDYIIFSNDILPKHIGVWEIRNYSCPCDDFVQQSRYPKINSHLFLNEYCASLYHDSNIQISSRAVYDRIIELCDLNVNWAGMNHPFHNCLYDELFLIPNLQFEHDYIAAKWGHQLIRSGFPRHVGFFENNIIFRKHTPAVISINEMWWSIMLKTSRRDQFSLRYVLWILNEPLVYFFPKDQTPRNTPHFRYFPHNSVSNKKKLISMTYLEKVRRCIRIEHKDLEESFKKQYLMIYHSFCPKILLLLWGVVYGLKYYFPIILRRKIKSSLIWIYRLF